MIKFEVGKTYYTTSICDHNCIYQFTVKKRTEKSLWITGGRGGSDIIRKKISIWNNEEQVFPNGHYSMSAVIGAGDTQKPLTDWEKNL